MKSFSIDRTTKSVFFALSSLMIVGTNGFVIHHHHNQQHQHQWGTYASCPCRGGGGGGSDGTCPGYLSTLSSSSYRFRTSSCFNGNYLLRRVFPCRRNSRHDHHQHPKNRFSISKLNNVRGGGSNDDIVSSPVAAAAAGSPPLSKWMVPAIACATAYAAYNLCIKKASSSKPIPMDPLLGGVILQLVAATMGTALYIFRNLTMNVSASTTTSVPTAILNSGVLWSIAAGLSVGLAELLSFVVSGMNVKASQSIPTIVGGSVVIGTILGAVWLRERLSWKGWFGVVLISMGIAMVGIDPGTTVAH